MGDRKETTVDYSDAYAWIVGGECVNTDGFIDCRIYSEGEFTKPLFSEQQIISERQQLSAVAKVMRHSLGYQQKTGSLADQVKSLADRARINSDALSQAQAENKRLTRVLESFFAATSQIEAGLGSSDIEKTLSEAHRNLRRGVIEGIIFRRLMQERIESYTLEMAAEIDAALTKASPNRPSDSQESHHG